MHHDNGMACGMVNALYINDETFFSINVCSEQSKCSHFKSVCYYALSLSKRHNMFLGVQCTETCDSVMLPSFSNRIDVIPMGLQTPEW